MIYNRYNRIIMKGTTDMKKILSVLMSVGIIISTAACGDKTTKSPNDFTLVNNLGTTLSEVYVSESTSDDWGQNILGTTALENEKKLDLSFSGAPTATSVFDVAVLTSAGTEYQFKAIDLNTANVVTLEVQNGSPVASVQ